MYIYTYVCVCVCIHIPLLCSVSKEFTSSAGDQVRFLGQEVPLEKKMATSSSILAWRIPWTEEPGEFQSTGSQESNTT